MERIYYVAVANSSRARRSFYPVDIANVSMHVYHQLVGIVVR